MTDLTATAIEEITLLAVQGLAAEPVILDDAPDLIHRVIPTGYRVADTDLTEYKPAPRRRTGHPVFHVPASFAAYVAGQSVAGTTLYADVAGRPQVTAVIDGHEPADGGAPGWGGHRASLALRVTEPWKRWTGKSREEMDTESFAEFLENGAADIVEPDTATLIELARTLEVHKDVSYVNVTRPQSGARRLHYEETITARAGESGSIDIPETIRLGLAPWEGCDKFEVLAKFRFRLRVGKLALAYELVRPDAVLETAFVDVLDAVTEVTALTPLHGRP